MAPNSLSSSQVKEAHNKFLRTVDYYLTKDHNITIVYISCPSCPLFGCVLWLFASLTIGASADPSPFRPVASSDPGDPRARSSEEWGPLEEPLFRSKPTFGTTS